MRVRFPMFLATVLALGAAAPTARALTIVSYSFTAEPATNSLRFEVTLSGVPDFLTLDAANRQRDSFQYAITYDPTVANPGIAPGAWAAMRAVLAAAAGRDSAAAR